MSTVIYGRGPGAVVTPVVWQETVFGDMLKFDMPEYCNLIILCVPSDTGLKPRKLLLPHQVYREAIEKYGGDVVLMPVNCEEYINVKIGD